MKEEKETTEGRFMYECSSELMNLGAEIAWIFDGAILEDRDGRRYSHFRGATRIHRRRTGSVPPRSYLPAPIRLRPNSPHNLYRPFMKSPETPKNSSCLQAIWKDLRPLSNRLSPALRRLSLLLSRLGPGTYEVGEMGYLQEYIEERLRTIPILQLVTTGRTERRSREHNLPWASAKGSFT